HPELESFKPVRWVPSPNTPVFLVEESHELAADPNAVGHFPGTRYPVRADVHDLVTHNTAVLGILGVGKTFLALELVERMILAGVRVLIIDLTEQYEKELAPYVNQRVQEGVIEHLQKIGAKGKTNVQKNVEEGGSVGEFSSVVTDLVRSEEHTSELQSRENL